MALAVLLISCGTTVSETQGQAGHAGGAPTSAPAPTAGRPAGSPEPGWHRISNDRGGWSIDVPDGWFDRVTTLGIAIGSADFDASTVASMTEVRMSVRLLNYYDGGGLQAFARSNVWIATCAACTRVLESARIVIGGQDAEFYSVYQNQPKPFDELEPGLYWLIRSPFFADRVGVVTAIPARAHYDRWPSASSARCSSISRRRPISRRRRRGNR